MMYDRGTEWGAANPCTESDLQRAERERRASLLEESEDPTMAPRRCVWRCTMKRPHSTFTVFHVSGTLDDVQRARRRSELTMCEPVTLVSIDWERDL